MVTDLVALPALAILAGIGWFVALMPGRVRLRLGSALGFIFNAAGFRKSVIIQNLGRVFPLDVQDSKSMDLRVQAAYSHLGTLILEIFMLLGGLRFFSRNRARYVGFENWQAAKKLGRGVIIVSSHVGNWEVMAAAGALRGIDICLVTKKLKPGWIHRAIERGRLRCQVLGTYEPRTFRDVLKHLRGNGTVGFVLDQYSGPPVGIRVPVFGIPVGTAIAPAAVAKRTGAVVLPVVNWREVDGSFCVAIGDPIDWIDFPDPHRELAENTARYAAVLESTIREHWDQWLWTHQRFKGDLGPIKEDEWDEPRARR